MKYKSKGFTLIELVVVVAVLGILAGIAIPRFMNSTASARGSRILGDLRTIDSAITIYHTRTGKYPTEISELVGIETSDSGALLAAVPVPPTGKFIINKSNGQTMEYETDAEEYTLSSAGRATYRCKTGTEQKSTVEWYLTDSGLSFANSADMNAILDEFKNEGNYTFDSEAANTTKSHSSNVVNALKALGINLESLGAESWKWDSQNGFFFWTDVSISNLQDGTIVPVIRYNSKTGTYTVWKATVETTLKSDKVPDPYKTLTIGDQYQDSIKLSSGEQTYDKALEQLQLAQNNNLK